MKGIIGVVVAIGLFAAWRLLAPDLFISAEEGLGHGWDDARSEIYSNQYSAIVEHFEGITFGQNEQEAMANCMADGAIPLLNETDCSYKYNETTTSKSEHLKAQDSCLEKSGYADKLEKVQVKCIKEHFPDDWAGYAKVLTQKMTEGFKEHDNPAVKAKAKSIGACTVRNLIKLLNKSDCRPINKDATSIETVLNVLDECLEQSSELRDAFNDGMSECIASALE